MTDDTQKKQTTQIEPTDEDTAAERPAVRFGSATVDFARLGLNQIAYIRRAIINDVPVWSIHAATGDTLGAATTFEQAWGAVLQNDLAPMRVH
jgi:hypothetical protein